MLRGHVLDEVFVVTLEYRDQPLLQRVPYVVRLDHRVRLGVEDLLDVVEHRARSASTPCSMVAESVKFLRRVAQTPRRVGDLRVRSHHHSVGTAQCENDGHPGDVLTAGRLSTWKAADG